MEMKSFEVSVEFGQIFSDNDEMQAIIDNPCGGLHENLEDEFADHDFEIMETSDGKFSVESLSWDIMHGDENYVYASMEEAMGGIYNKIVS